MTKKDNADNSIRQSNFEFLRIIAMCMIIAMHYMTKGMQIPKLSVDTSLHNIIFRLLFAFCSSAVNVYVFISGYFAVDSKWSVSKLIRLWLQVLLYSILIPVIMNIAGAVDISSMNLSVKQQIFLPISYEHYWFATAYVMLYLFSPILTAAIKHLDKKQLGAVIIMTLTVFCGFKSVNPYLIPWDKYGDDVIWFIILYLIAGYIRMYGIPFFEGSTGVKATDGTQGQSTGTSDTVRHPGRALAIYIIFSSLTFAIAYAASCIVRATGKMEYYMDMTYCYNYITILIASIGLFYTFKNLNIKYSAWINRLAGYTFGVYLLHENITLRELWPRLLGIDSAMGQWWQFFHMLFCIIVVFVIGCIVDYLRTYIFGLIRR
ncbi:MAG: acyltransferase [Lachnospiraceae bacterium]|nr:acyltransferase [Lachnospiraceae bacterium]